MAANPFVLLRTDIDELPSYSKAMNEEPTSLSLRIANAQRDRVQTVVEAHIDSLLQAHIDTGLASAAFALVPTDVHALQTNSENSVEVLEKVNGRTTQDKCSEQIVSFQHEGYVKIARLHGAENSSGFWRQQSVLRELESQVRLKFGLGSSPVRKPEFLKGPQDLQSMTKVERREWKQRNSISWLGTADDCWSRKTQTALRQGEIEVEVEEDQISIRRETDLGLYETNSGPVVVVKIRFGM